MVALHGWARTRHDWEPVLAGMNALALDLPGFGATSAPPQAWNTADYADALLPLVAGSPRIVVGHSFGGRIAVHLAARAPERVAALVLTGVPLLRGPRTGRAKPAYRLARFLHAHGLLTEPAMERYRQRYGSADYRAAQGVMREILVKAVNEDYTEQLKAIAAAAIPTVLVWGQADTAAPVAMASTAAQLLGPAARLTVVPGSAHLLDQPLVSALRTAIDEVGTR